MEHKPVCIIIGASHGGVTCAFALRREGWSGEIHLYDGDADLPYHRPPLSKAYLGEGVESQLLKPAESYAEENITLHLGRWVERIDPAKRVIILADGEERTYDKLVLATGGTPLIPELSGLRGARNVFTLRTAQNARNIRNANGKRVVVIGGGYIGLEVAASLRKQGAEVTILEREKRVLSRVTAPIMSHFFRELHEDHGVNIVIGATVGGIAWERTEQHVVTMGGAWYPADLIVVGVGIRPNVSLAANAGLTVERCIVVDTATRTSDEHIYAIGDCTEYYSLHYDRTVHLESVQNAVDQAKVAAAAICGKEAVYDTIPWFWSDQYDVKLQLVGLSEGYDEVVMRREERERCFSVWYFRGERLLAVDAVNNGKAYVLGQRFLKGGMLLNKKKLVDSKVRFHPAELVR